MFNTKNLSLCQEFFCKKTQFYNLTQFKEISVLEQGSKIRIRQRSGKKLLFEAQLHLPQNQIDHQGVGEVTEVLPHVFVGRKKGTSTL
jgi:hypothetical protein